jgi:hypothetical protein
MSDAWYVRSRKRIEGPFTRSQLRQASLTGSITPDTLVSQCRTSGWVEAKRIDDLQFGTTIERSAHPLRPAAEKKRPQSVRGRKRWVVLGGGVATVTALLIALTFSQPDKPTPLAESNTTTIVERAPAEAAKNPISGQAAKKSPPAPLITQRWQRRWMRQH